MTEQSAPIVSLVHVGDRTPMPSHPGRATPFIAFDRRELAAILAVYGRKVGAGEWRDYAMDFLRERAVFSVFARHSEHHLFMIEKHPRLARRQGQYLVTNHQGRVLKRGHDLRTVLRVLDPQLALVP